MINIFDHNFDVEETRGVHRDASAASQAMADLKEQLEAARQQGFDAGRDLGRKEAAAEFDAAAEERFEQDRHAIQDQLAHLIAQDTKQHSDNERDIIELFLGIAERLVPELIQTYGPALAVDRIRQAVQQARTDPVLTIRACPELAETLETETPGWLHDASHSAEIDLVADSQLARGAVQVRWKGGRLDYDMQAACTTVLKSLAQAAQDYTEATEKAG